MTIDESDEIAVTVKETVAAALAIPVEELSLDKRLIDDLGADSLDFVDIVFQLESSLGIEVKDSEFAFLTRLDFSSPEVMRDGVLTQEVVDRLADWLPALAAVPDRAQVSPRQLFSFITLEAIAIVATRQREKRRD